MHTYIKYSCVSTVNQLTVVRLHRAFLASTRKRL